jgi:hypothetical protein
LQIFLFFFSAPQHGATANREAARNPGNFYTRANVAHANTKTFLQTVSARRIGIRKRHEDIRSRIDLISGHD